MRILLIEDDKALCQVLQPTLQAAGFASDCCHTGADGLHLLKTGYYDACILDRMLPELDGLTLLKSARADGVSIPVLMLTALGQIGDRVDGLDAGADDYLTKPFDLDTSQLTLTGPSSTVTHSRRECDLLAAFCRAPGLLRARTVLLGSVWGSAAEIEDCSLDSYIRFIRRRLTAVGSRAVLRTVRGAGYRFLPDGEEDAHV